ncbi:MAG TPA: hypothetical protein VMI34_24585, partial [Candidatus Bathyarchaeia archaeon]|nr:hypothetical protein [Candidatus Bathyarchaeia archaeon]
MIDLRVLRAKLRRAGSPWRASANRMHRLPARAKRRHLGYVPGRRELPLERAEEIARAREEVHRKPPQRRRRKAPKTWDWRDIGGHS